MSTHTPGPWTFVHEGGIDGGYFIDAKEDVVVLPRGRLNEADARLIAAAPDLLAACTDMISFIEDYAASAEEDDPVHELLPRYRAAIAKAEGVS